MSYTLGELRALLADLESLPDSVEVRLATQPNYPFENSIAQAKLVNPSQDYIDQVRSDIASGSLTDEEVVEAERLMSEKEADDSVLYLCEGSQLGYVSRSLWDQE